MKMVQFWAEVRERRVARTGSVSDFMLRVWMGLCSERF